MTPAEEIFFDHYTYLRITQDEEQIYFNMILPSDKYFALTYLGDDPDSVTKENDMVLFVGNKE